MFSLPIVKVVIPSPSSFSVLAPYSPVVLTVDVSSNSGENVTGFPGLRDVAIGGTESRNYMYFIISVLRQIYVVTIGFSHLKVPYI